MPDLTIVLAEEIGNPDLFTGRKQELAFYLRWAENTKNLLSKSQAILSRRKKGKTALVQRLFNILYSNNDAGVIPFFFRVPEQPLRTADFGQVFYRAFLSQYLGFRQRNPSLINEQPTLYTLKELAKNEPKVRHDIEEMERLVDASPGLVWGYAQSAPHRFAKSNDIRIVQIIDEFQYMNRFIYDDRDRNILVDLCHTYMGLAESKYAPLIVTGSYIGWLSTILSHMTARFEDVELGSLTDEEALETTYNYAAIFGQEVNEITAAYIAEVAYNDPFYISQIIRTRQPDLDLTSKEGVRAALQFETTYGKGFVAKIWMEYIAEGLTRVNDINGKKIVLYLAKEGNKECGRDQIHEDLNLDISDSELELRLTKLQKADLIAPGSSAFHFKGLGDPIFAVVFRKHYGTEIEKLTTQKITAEFDQQMKSIRGEAAWYKGMAGEYRVMYLLQTAANQNKPPGDVLFNPTEGFTLTGLSAMNKRTFHHDPNHKNEVDIYSRGKNPGDMDLIAEVKTWAQPVSNEVITHFIELKQRLVGKLDRKTAFLFYSENGFSDAQQKLMCANEIMYTTAAKLSAWQPAATQKQS